MPILLMALLALLVFGIIGFLLASAVILEQSKHRHAVGSAADSGASGAAPPLTPKVR